MRGNDGEQKAAIRIVPMFQPSVILGSAHHHRFDTRVLIKLKLAINRVISHLATL